MTNDTLAFGQYMESLDADTLRLAIQNAGRDVLPCEECGEPVVYYPDDPALCWACNVRVIDRQKAEQR